MYTTHFLKFPDKETFDAIAQEVGYAIFSEALLNEEGQVISPVQTYYSTELSGPGAIDMVGALFNDDAVYGEIGSDGTPTLVSPPTQKQGFHVNIALQSDLELPGQFAQYILDPAPSSPHRVFA